MRITAENTMVIAIDYQEKLVPAMADNETLINKTKILLGGCRALQIPLVVTTQYAKGLGNMVENLKTEIENVPIIDKHCFSVWENEKVRSEIPKGTKNIILCGMESHICVLQSVIDLQEAGYQTIIVADCIASREREDKAYALVRGEKEGSIITTAEAILYEMMADSKHTAFKQISALVK